jgi:hypothetical protein
VSLPGDPGETGVMNAAWLGVFLIVLAALGFLLAV